MDKRGKKLCKIGRQSGQLRPGVASVDLPLSISSLEILIWLQSGIHPNELTIAVINSHYFSSISGIKFLIFFILVSY